MNKYILMGALCLLAELSPLRAQAPAEVLNFSNLQPLSTARSSAVGDAMGALGGDMATLSINPSGLGVYRNSEFIFTPVITTGNVQSSFQDGTSRNNRNAFNIGSLGALFSVPVKNPMSNWKYVNFGFTFNRLASLHQTFGFDGTTPGSRIVNMVNSAQGLHPDDLNPFENQMAYDAFLIDLDGSGANSYEGALTDNNFVRKRQQIHQSGGVNEVAISLAGNSNNKFFVGGTIGIPIARFTDIRNYRETEETGNIDFKEMSFNETREVRGTGINVKGGIQYRFTPQFRMGLHVHTPTWYGIRETYYTQLSGSVVFNDEIEENTFNSPTGQYRHNLRTPWLLGASMSFVGRYGFWGLDVEHINYAGGRFSLRQSGIGFVNLDDQDFIDAINQDISQNLFGRAWRVRTGAEFVLGDFRLRGGYRLQTSPYQEKLAAVSDLLHNISAGVGIRRRRYFIDLTYVHTLAENEYLPFATTQGAFPQQVRNKINMGYIMASIAFRFGFPKEQQQSRF